MSEQSIPTATQGYFPKTEGGSSRNEVVMQQNSSSFGEHSSFSSRVAANSYTSCRLIWE